MITTIEQLLEIYNVKTEKELNWTLISINQTLSEEFIEKHSNKVNWYCISIHQILSESFIERNSEKLNWVHISINQKLSESFIERNSIKVEWYWVTLNQTISKGFIEKNWELIPIISVARNCGKENRNIYRFKDSPEIIHIGCFKGTKEEAIEVIKKEYSFNSIEMQEYIDKVNDCFNTTLID